MIKDQYEAPYTITYLQNLEFNKDKIPVPYYIDISSLISINLTDSRYLSCIRYNLTSKN